MICTMLGRAPASDVYSQRKKLIYFQDILSTETDTIPWEHSKREWWVLENDWCTEAVLIQAPLLATSNSL